MNYIELIRGLWRSHEENSFTPTEIAVYFYLVEVCNICQWKNPFKRNNAKIGADLGISFNTLKNARNKLQQAGLISFKTTNGSPNVIYTLSNFDKVSNEVDVEVTNEVSNEVDVEVLPTKDKLNKTKTKQNRNTPPTPPSGDGKRESMLDEKEKALLALEDELRKREQELATIQKPLEKKEKSPNPLNSGGRKIFEDHFRNTFSSDYYWTAKDAGSMTSLLRKLKFQREQKKMPTDDNNILVALKFILESIDDGWIFENFSVTNINSKFNEIVTQVKAKKNATRKQDKDIARKSKLIEYFQDAFSDCGKSD